MKKLITLAMVGSLAFFLRDCHALFPVLDESSKVPRRGERCAKTTPNSPTVPAGIKVSTPGYRCGCVASSRAHLYGATVSLPRFRSHCSLYL